LLFAAPVQPVSKLLTEASVCWRLPVRDSDDQQEIDVCKVALNRISADCLNRRPSSPKRFCFEPIEVHFLRITLAPRNKNQSASTIGDVFDASKSECRANDNFD
jgi:hypothetical protein